MTGLITVSAVNKNKSLLLLLIPPNCNLNRFPFFPSATLKQVYYDYE